MPLRGLDAAGAGEAVADAEAGERDQTLARLPALRKMVRQTALCRRRRSKHHRLNPIRRIQRTKRIENKPIPASFRLSFQPLPRINRGIITLLWL